MSIFLRLSVLMFLQFFIWGAWYTSVSNFMLAQGLGGNIYFVFTAGPLGAIIAPFFLGLIADRFFNTEKILFVLFLLCGISLFLIPRFNDIKTVNALIFIHMILYMPTLALTASLAFTHLKDAKKQFPLIRVWGTLGWIVAGIIISVLQADETATQFTVAGLAGIALSFICLILPKTPPPLKGKKIDVGALFFREAWSLLKNPSFAVFVGCSMLICIPLAAYYAFSQVQLGQLGVDAVAATKTMGQGSEVIFMFLMPFFFRKLGVKKMIAIGIFAWALRYLLFAIAVEPQYITLFYVGLLLHGICYDFFFVTGQIYVESTADENIRGQAQSLIVFFTQGLGLLIGAWVSGLIYNGTIFGVELLEITPAGADNMAGWTKFWIPLMAMAIVILIAFMVMFKPSEKKIKFEH